MRSPLLLAVLAVIVAAVFMLSGGGPTDVVPGALPPAGPDPATVPPSATPGATPTTPNAGGNFFSGDVQMFLTLAIAAGAGAYVLWNWLSDGKAD